MNLWRVYWFLPNVVYATFCGLIWIVPRLRRQVAGWSFGQ